VQLFLDTGKTDEIRHALEVWDADGFTTNPRHVQASGKPLRALLEEIASLVAGTTKPVSVEVNPRRTDWERIVDEGFELAALSPNFVIKVGASERGFRAVRELTARGVRTNVTLVFAAAQAWHAARCGATYVSPFLGWKDAHGDDSRTLLPETLAVLRNYGYATRVIAAALRNARQIAEAAFAGAHCATAGFDVYRDSFRHPYTTMGEDLFGAAWDATPRDADRPATR
jgi:transaldolase